MIAAYLKNEINVSQIVLKDFSGRITVEKIGWEEVLHYAPIHIGVDAKNNVNLNSYTTTLICWVGLSYASRDPC